MYYILYNPLSRNGSSLDVVKKLEAEFQKDNKDFTTLDLIEVSKEVENFLKRVHEEDKIVLIGGDGTLHRFANGVKHISFPNQVFLFKAGTGNDFSREFKKGDLIDITKYIRNIPSCAVDGGEAELFLNCAGYGVDGEVCALVNNSNESKKGIHYFQNAMKTFKNFKRYDLEMEVDGVRHTYKNVWFATVMNGNYFGGGMKLSPDSNRDDDVMEAYVVHSVGLVRLMLIFPWIFLGKHMLFKKVGISKVVGHHFKLHASSPQVFQADGEVLSGVKDIELIHE